MVGWLMTFLSRNVQNQVYNLQNNKQKKTCMHSCFPMVQVKYKRIAEDCIRIKDDDVRNCCAGELLAFNNSSGSSDVSVTGTG